MEEIRDCKNRLICMGDARTGSIQALYKGLRMETQLSLGQQLIIERQMTKTTITRVNDAAFRVESFDCAEIGA